MQGVEVNVDGRDGEKWEGGDLDRNGEEIVSGRGVHIIWTFLEG